MADLSHLSADERRLAELGYKQELNRSWSGFSNFAISFSIISILAGCFTNFGAGFNNGGPISISWSWPILSIFILIIGFTMSELVSSYPTSGGIYWWAAKMGGPVHGWFTGWLNLIGGCCGTRADHIAALSAVAVGCGGDACEDAAEVCGAGDADAAVVSTGDDITASVVVPASALGNVGPGLLTRPLL